ncbi:MAG: flagellin [Phycisphaerae bacterium]|nr:flagellin [Phycisphaerae bacterium]
MARINTNVPSVIAQFNLSRNDAELDLRLQRLATGLRINRGADDPAGLIVSERLQTDIKGVEQAIRNGDRASSVIATTEAALVEVTDLLNSVKALIVEAANTGGNSAEEREANQLQIDSAIQSITRISNTASFGGLRLLDGSLDYVTSGVTNSTIEKAQIFGASFVGTSRLQVDVDVLASAQTAALYLSTNDGAAGEGVFNAGTLQSQLTIEVAGVRGVQEFTFASGTPLSDIVSAINSRSALTGVTASSIGGANLTSGLVLRSEGYGSGAFVSVERRNLPAVAVNSFDPQVADGNAAPPTGATFPWTTYANFVSASRDQGQNVQALINGNLANGDGLNVSINSAALSLELQLDESFAIDPTLTASTFNIIGGGALFQLGPEINALQQANVGVPSIAASRLGGVLVGGGLQFLSSLAKGQINSIAESARRNDFSNASDIIDAAIDEVTILRGRLGAFERNVLDTNKRSLQSAQENLTASRSVILDADFAAETSRLTRAQILQQSTTSVLQLANQRSQSVLSLLG